MAEFVALFSLMRTLNLSRSLFQAGRTCLELYVNVSVQKGDALKRFDCTFRLMVSDV